MGSLGGLFALRGSSDMLLALRGGEKISEGRAAVEIAEVYFRGRSSGEEVSMRWRR